MNTLSIEYSPEILWAMQLERDEFASQARLLLALKLYEIGRLSSGLAAQLAGVPRTTFFYILSQHNLSPFGVDEDELMDDFNHARAAVTSASNSE